MERLFDRAADLIVAVGGDGTVASVAREVAGHDVPLAVLPVGTANNIAFSLGCDGPLDELIDHWPRAVAAFARTWAWRADRGENGASWRPSAAGWSRAASPPSTRSRSTSRHEPDHRIELAVGGYLNVLSRLGRTPGRSSSTAHAPGRRFPARRGPQHEVASDPTSSSPTRRMSSTARSRSPSLAKRIATSCSPIGRRGWPANRRRCSSRRELGHAGACCLAAATCTWTMRCSPGPRAAASS